MAVVTNATIGYGRSKRPGDFESRTPSVSFSIQFDENDDYVAISRQVFHDAVELVEEAADGKVNLAERAAQVERPKRGRPAGPTKLASSVVAEAGVSAEEAQTATTDDMGAGPTVSAATPSAVETVVTSTVEAISDQALQAAVAPVSATMRKQTAAKNGGPGDIVALIELIHQYAGPPPAGLSAIPQAKRAQFIADAKMLVAEGREEEFNRTNRQDIPL